MKQLEPDEVDVDIDDDDIVSVLGESDVTDSSEPTEPAGGEDEAWGEDDKCVVELDGADWTGVITKVIDEETVKVKFDADGEVLEIPVDDLKEPEAENGSSKSGEENEVSLKSDKVDGKNKRAIGILAKKYDFDVKDYDDTSMLLLDIAGYLGIEGKFATVTKLVAACKKAKPAE
jgi:hypothetical protein